MRPGAVLAAALLLAAGRAPGGEDEAGVVSFWARTTAMQTGAPAEFLVVGPDSDHAYEALFTTEEPVAEIVRRFRAAGFRPGRPTDVDACRLWPVGAAVDLAPAFGAVARETRGEALPAFVYTGGRLDAGGRPEACTNMPQAVIALYDCPQALIVMDGDFPQSPTYGRFVAPSNTVAGQRVEFRIRRAAAPETAALALEFSAGNCRGQFERLRAEAERRPVDLLATFAPDLTVREAAAIAAAIAEIDSPRIKLNGAGEGDFFYRAFLPKEQWRDRKERLMQPPEIHVDAKGGIRIVEALEDWSDRESLDPKLSLREHPCADEAAAARLAGRIAAKTRTVLFFAPADAKLAGLQAIRRRIAEPIRSCYVFAE